MKKNCKIFFYSIVLKSLMLFCLQNSFANDSTAFKYFPLNVGDTYLYIRFTNENGIPSSTYIRATITKDTVINSKKYFLYYNGFPWMRNNLLRIDSLTGSLNKYDSTNSCSFYFYERQLDSLGANLNEIPLNCNLGSLSKCTQINGIDIWGLNSTEKIFYWETLFGGGGAYEEKLFIKNIGYYSYRMNYHISGYSIYQAYTLKGCVINGITYGDTTVTNVRLIYSNAPSKMELYQNYPNPFNPSTVIKFEVQQSSNVKLSIYNSLGTEVVTLVNEILRAGSYESTFEGSNFTSGIYFYKLDANGYSETKRMLLLK